LPATPDKPAPSWSFEPVAAHLGAAYLRYSFTKGTAQEVTFLVGALGLTADTRLLDVGCGPGRHVGALADRGMAVTGVDLAENFVRLAAERVPKARLARADARRLPFADAAFDVVLSLCQGGFGLVGDDDGTVVAEMARCVRPGGRVVLSAFSSYFAVRFLEDTDAFDAALGINHERTTVRNEAGEEAEFDLYTSCFTPRELRLMCGAAGLDVEHLWSVTPGAYGDAAPDLDHPEWLVVAKRPGGSLERG
jgi:SAM-dependent methyltransferase